MFFLLARPHVLTRLDGVESVAIIIGTAVSPFLADSIGYMATYVMRSCFYLMAVIYITFFVHEKVSYKEKVSILLFFFVFFIM